MALIVSAASGNFNAGATWVGGVVPGVGDEARASTGHTITITANATCDEVSNAGTGIFTLNDGVTLTANVTSKSTTTARNCLQFTAATPASASIVGNVTGGTVTDARAVAHTSTGTLTITGNLLGGTGSGAHAVLVSSTGTLNVTGNVTGGSVVGSAYGIHATGNSSLLMTGNVFGGSANLNVGIFLTAFSANVTITGNTTGGTAGSTAGIYHNGTGIVTITGIATGGTLGGVGGNTSAGVHNNTTATIVLKRAVGNAYGPGNMAGLAPTPGAHNAALGIIQVEEIEYGLYGMLPVTGGGLRLKKVSTNQAVFNYVDVGAAKTLVDATQGQMPAASDVRHGISYASGALTGTCRVPAAASVAFGVQVDATTGTAYLSQSDVLAAVWGAATSSLTTAGSIGERLKNAATVATTGEQLATALTAP